MNKPDALQMSMTFADGIAFERSFHDEAQLAVEYLGHSAMQLVPTGSMMHFGGWLGWPDWMREGTSLNGTGKLPMALTVSDDLVMVANLLTEAGAFPIIERVLHSVNQPIGPTASLAFANAPDLRHALEAFARLNNLMRPYFHASVEEQAGTIALVFEQRLPPSRVADFISFLIMLAAYRLVASYFLNLGEELEVTCAFEDAVRTQSALPDFRCRLTVDPASNRIAMPADWAKARTELADRGLWQLALQQIAIAERKQADPPLIRTIRSRVAGMLAAKQRVPRMKELATDGLSVRTIARLLASHGTSYHEIVDKERRSRAMLLICDPTLTLSDVATALGYPDSSSFGRSFRRWYGESPGQFRHAGASD